MKEVTAASMTSPLTPPWARRIRRREQPFLSLKGYGNMFALNYAQQTRTKTAVEWIRHFLFVSCY